MKAAGVAREEVLARIRTALPGEPLDPAGSYAHIERGYRAQGGLSREETLALLIDRLLDYDTELHQVDGEGEIAGAVGDALRRAQERRLLVPQAFPEAWIPGGVEARRDAGDLSYAEIESAEAVLTTCEAAVASSGTLVLVHGGAQGRRVLTLLPDHHVCVVRRDQVYGSLPEAMCAMQGSWGKPITTVSGPSATSDIEMTRIRGVHGPRRLSVVLYGSS